MRQKKIIIDDFKDSTEEYLNTLYNFPDKHFNTKPSEKSWSAGQVANHLLKTEFGSIQVLKGNAKVVNRNPENKIFKYQRGFSGL